LRHDLSDSRNCFLSSFQRKLESSFRLTAKELDYQRLLSRALRAIRYANVRFGILPPQSGFRRDDEL
jgi:hypothetical protein